MYIYSYLKIEECKHIISCKNGLYFVKNVRDVSYKKKLISYRPESVKRWKASLQKLRSTSDDVSAEEGRWVHNRK